MNIKTRQNGFTVVEFLAVMAILSILATITVISYGSWRKSVGENVLKNDLNGVASVMESTRTFTGTYPAVIPVEFTPSQGTTLTGGGLTGGTSYCISATSTSTSNSYRIYNDESPEVGSC